jgi:hypothetical protein
MRLRVRRFRSRSLALTDPAQKIVSLIGNNGEDRGALIEIVLEIPQASRIQDREGARVHGAPRSGIAERTTHSLPKGSTQTRAV